MRTHRTPRSLKASLTLAASLSAIAVAGPAAGQDEEPDSELLSADTIVVTGIRRSLEASADVKRNSQGVVDAINAEDIGKFPDTNLAESLQRITGVSIDRQNGEGQSVTVRGFGPEYNLVLLNGRQMPTALLGAGAPSSRSFDFQNIASEGISGVRVYKTGRAAIPTGGIGSSLNILTSRPLDRPGLNYSVGAKAVIDESPVGDEDTSITPELSGIYSNTFADDTFGVTIAGSYQDRESGFAQASTPNGWRGAYTGDQNNWGTLPDTDQITNRPGDDQLYLVPQAVNFALANIDRERINGQLALQYRPVDSVTATLDYFYSQNKIATERNDLSVWFNHVGDNVSAAFTDGQIADPIFYAETFPETFAPGDDVPRGSDLSMGAAQFATKAENKSLGFNVEWEATSNLTFELDVHSSSAENGEDSPYGTTNTVGTADFQLGSQRVNFENDIPILTLGYLDGFTQDLDPSRMRATGSVFGNSFLKTEIDQAQLFASYEFDEGIVQSLDFGVAATRNDVRSAFANAQRDSWGGVARPENFPDDIWERLDLAGNFDELDGHDDPAMQQDFLAADFNALIAVLDQPITFTDSEGNVQTVDPLCGGDGICRSDDFTTDRRIEEESYSAFAEISTAFDIGIVPASLVAGVRYEKTDVFSEALVPDYNATAWISPNEFVPIESGGEGTFTSGEGSYEYFLPAIDFQLEPNDEFVIRTSYSHTLTRPSYADLQGGLTIDTIFRVDGGTGNQGDPDLLPFLSRNFDLSAEWYYDEGSYLSVGYFYKKVDNFIGRGTVRRGAFDLVTPFGGERYEEAVAALGGDDDAAAIRQYIGDNFPETTEDRNGQLFIFGVPGEDPELLFNVGVPVNERTGEVDGWEFAIQHIFGDTGFGAILNYTIVNGDVTFDNNRLPPAFDTDPNAEPQFALLGLSDSANVVGFYDKNGVQVRAAYNWRDKFLNSTIGPSGTNGNPLYTTEYGQLDLTASYEVRDGLTVFAEGINVLDETNRIVGRTDAYANFVTQTGPRWGLGIRFTN